MKYSIIVLTIVSALLTGCASTSIDTKIADKKSGTWQVERVSTSNIDGIVKVSGYMKQSKSYASRKGHVDITVLTGNGEQFLQTTAPLGKRIMRRGGDYFTADISQELPEDSTIVVEFHNEKHSCNKHENAKLD